MISRQQSYKEALVDKYSSYVVASIIFSARAYKCRVYIFPKCFAECSVKEERRRPCGDAARFGRLKDL